MSSIYNDEDGEERLEIVVFLILRDLVLNIQNVL